MKNKGFNLIEFTVGLSLITVAVVMTFQLYSARQKESKKEESAISAFSQIRQFFDGRRKMSQAASEALFTPFGDSRYIHSKTFAFCNKGENGCQETFRILESKGKSTLCGEVREILTVDCVRRNPQIPEIDLNSLSGPGAVAFSQCVPGRCVAVNGRLGGLRNLTDGSQVDELPRIKINRIIPRLDPDGSCQSDEVVTYFPQGPSDLSSDGSDGNPIAAAVCITGTSGEPLGVVSGVDCDAELGSLPAEKRQARIEKCQPKFRDYNLSVFMITRFSPNRFDLIQQVSNFPQPKLPNPGGIQVLQQLPRPTK